MKIEELVLSIEQAKHLQELGLDMSDAALCWSDAFSASGNLCNILFYAKDGMEEFQNIPTYTLQEVWNKLPYKIKTPRYDILQLDFIDYELMYHDKETCYVKHWETGKIIESAYDMLCWVLENGYYKEDKQ